MTFKAYVCGRLQSAWDGGPLVLVEIGVHSSHELDLTCVDGTYWCRYGDAFEGSTFAEAARKAEPLAKRMREWMRLGERPSALDLRERRKVTAFEIDIERAMATVEKHLRERSVYEVAFTEATFSGPERRTYLEVKPIVGRSVWGATLVEAWRRLIGPRKDMED